MSSSGGSGRTRWWTTGAWHRRSWAASTWSWTRWAPACAPIGFCSALDDLARLVTEGGLRPAVDTVFPLEAGGVRGKYVVRVV